jgi:hypothetical protein
LLGLQKNAARIAALRFQSAAEAARDWRRKPCVRVVEAAREQVAFAGGVQREELRQAFARIPFSALAAVHEQIHFAGEARERGHRDAAGVVFDDEFRNENRVGEIWERVIEALACVHAAERVEVGGSVFADEQEYVECGGVPLEKGFVGA